jgi:hypothetical protein
VIDEVISYINDECGNAAQRNRLDGIQGALRTDVGEVCMTPAGAHMQSAATTRIWGRVCVPRLD